MRWRHKASGAALGLSCVACFEQPAGVFAGCGASTHLFVKIISRENHLERAGWRLPKPLNPQSLRDFPLSGGHRLHYIPAGGSTAAIFKENLADVPPRRLVAPGNLGIVGIPAVWDTQKSHWSIVSTSREIHLERTDPLQVPVGHYPVPGGDKLPSPGTATPILHHCGAYPRSR